MQYVTPDESATIEIVGVDGSVWTVSGQGEGHEGVVLHKGAQGLQEAPRKTVWSQSASQEGSTPQGVSIDPLDLVLAFDIYGDEENWSDVTSRFRNAWSYEEDTTIKYQSESGLRTLQVRMSEAPDRNADKDPRLVQYSLETYTVRAGWPFWEGEGTTDTMKCELQMKPAENIIETMAQALITLFNLEPLFSNYAQGTVTVSNPTDRPLWPQWICTGPGRWGIPDWSWKDDDQANRVVICPTQSDGEDLSIDTYPRSEPYVSKLNTNIAGRFGGVLFLNPIPPHTPSTEIPIFYVGHDSDAEISVVLREYWNSPAGGE